VSTSAVELLGVGKRYRFYPSDFARLLEIITSRPRHKSVDALHGIDLRIEHGEALGQPVRFNSARAMRAARLRQLSLANGMPSRKLQQALTDFTPGSRPIFRR